jgi:CRP/FNR family transcriptional regulator, cyclic AMP receptor protein
MLERHLPRWLAWTIDPEQARRAPFLAHSPLFAGLPRRLLGRLGTRFLEKAYSSGDVVFHEGDPGRALFVVVEGSVEILQATPRGEHVVRTLGAGDAFGELALLDESRRSGSARVAEPARLLILYKTDFDALMESEARIAVVVMRNLSRILATYARRHPVVVTEPASRPEADERP